MTELIKTWKQLSKVKPNNKYRLRIKILDGCGFVETIDGEYVDYLSTHTFYGKNYKESTERLQEYGFDIKIDNWDKEVE